MHLGGEAGVHQLHGLGEGRGVFTLYLHYIQTIVTLHLLQLNGLGMGRKCLHCTYTVFAPASSPGRGRGCLHWGGDEEG